MIMLIMIVDALMMIVDFDDYVDFDDVVYPLHLAVSEPQSFC